MPAYDYLCNRCGPFTLTRPMSEYDLGADCPSCARASPRVIMTAPQLSTLAPGLRRASAINERSAHAPRSSSRSDRAHGSGCSCCSAKASKSATRRVDGAKPSPTKSFPTRRPWMISH
jgi:putative FmdB family regulatory protein